MTTVFQGEQHYTSNEWLVILADAQELFANHLTVLGQMAIEERQVIAASSQRHSVPLNTSGYTSPENGCYQCGKAMHYTELDKLAERGLPPDTCLRCHHNDECPTCHGTSEVGTGKRLLSHD